MFLHFSLLCLQPLHKYLSSVQKINTLVSLLSTSLMASEVYTSNHLRSFPMLAPCSAYQIAAASENGHTDTKHHGQGS